MVHAPIPDLWKTKVKVRNLSYSRASETLGPEYKRGCKVEINWRDLDVTSMSSYGFRPKRSLDFSHAVFKKCYVGT